MVKIYILGRYSKSIIWQSVYLPKSQAIGLSKAYRLLVPKEYDVKVGW